MLALAWKWLPENVSVHGAMVDSLFWTILVITGIIFVATELLLIYFVFRYRYREGRRAVYSHGHTKLEIIWTIIPAIILAILAFMSQSAWSRIRMQPPAMAYEIEILGEQFAWNVRYPGADGKFGAVKSALIATENPFGIDTADVASRDDITTINQLHIPLNEMVRIHLRSKDVLHSFFVAELRMKQDLVPGMTIPIWFEPTKAGVYDLGCAELCGLGHYRMKGFVTVEPADSLAAWLVATKAEE